jgi:hemolysin activation/secretion protein
MFHSVVVLSQPNNISTTAEQLRRVQQEQQQRQQKQFQEDIKQSVKNESFDVDLPELQQSKKDQPCQTINEINLEGIESFKYKDFEVLLLRYQDKCLDVTAIQNLMSEITAKYILAGYVTARVYLSEQDISAGSLTLLILEGFLENVEIEENEQGSVSLFNVFAGNKNEPLNLRDIEQALENLNRLQSNDATMLINPGKVSGASKLIFKNDASRRWHANVNTDNYGSKSTGEEQVGVNLSIDRPFNWNDYVSLTYRQTVPYHTEDIGSRLMSLSYIVPFGYSRLTINGSKSEYSSPLNLPSNIQLQSSGESSNITTRFDHTLYRDRDSRWELAATINNKDSKSFIDKQLIEVSSRRLTVLDIESNYQFVLGGASVFLNIGYSKGLDILNALNDESNLPEFVPRAQFSKWFLAANVSKSVIIKNQPIIFSSQMTGQYSNDVLYGSEMLLVGGLYTVRGFSENSLSAEHGFYLRNDVSLPITVSMFNNLPLLLKPYLGFDYGQVKGINEGSPNDNLSGLALGLSLNTGNLNADIFAARALKRPSEFDREGTLLSFRMSYSF